ncbi:MAG: cell wall anchor protein [Kouleothrix sp.]|nr:cell wall anchor protein [Kouleothrix sp.]
MKRLISALAVLAALVAVFGAGAPARAADDPSGAAQAALGWLLARQQADGSFAGFDAGASADAVFAIVAVGSDPNGVLKNGSSPVSYLGTQAASYAAKSPAAAGKLALAVVAAGKDPRNFGGQNLLQILLKTYNGQTGQYGADITGHAYALLALASAGQPIPPAAIAALEKSQLPDGGWSFDGSAATGSDTNTAALAVQALVAAGAKGEPLGRALAYLKSQQNADGGFPYSRASAFGTDSDANSTAVVIQALVAAGEDPRALRRDADPVGALLRLQNPSGAFRYQAALPDDNDLASAQAIPALLLRPFPLKTTSLPAVQAPAPAPASLPRTAGAPDAAWLALLALALLAGGLALKPRGA